MHFKLMKGAILLNAWNDDDLCQFVDRDQCYTLNIGTRTPKTYFARSSFFSLQSLSLSVTFHAATSMHQTKLSIVFALPTLPTNTFFRHRSWKLLHSSIIILSSSCSLSSLFFFLRIMLKTTSSGSTTVGKGFKSASKYPYERYDKNILCRPVRRLTASFNTN